MRGLTHLPLIHFLFPGILTLTGFARAQTTTTTTAGAASASAVFGQPVTLTATVTPSTATGKVTFYDETVILGSATLTNGAATFSTIGIGYGQRHVTARYIGDANDSPSLSAAIIETITTKPGGTFAAPSGPLPPPVGITAITPVAAADLNHDGYPDLIANSGSSSAPNGISVYLNNGDGTLANPVTYPGGGGVVSDVDLDGNPDLIVSYDGLAVLKGKGDGTFPIDSVIQIDNAGGTVKVADLNADGFPDLVVIRYNSTSETGYTTIVSVYLGNGDGTFQSLPDLQITGQFSDFAIGDFNRDGVPDIAIASETSSSMSVLFGNGDGTFGAATVYTTDYAADIAAADVNHDGLTDLIAGDIVFLGNTAGIFTPKFGATPGVSGPISIFDIDGDGNPDILSSAGMSFGNGDGSFRAPVPTAFASGIVADYNRDGIPDAAATATLPETGISVHSGKLAPVLTLTASPNPATAGQPLTLTVTSSYSDATGTLTVYNLNQSQTTIGTAALTNGSATVGQAQAIRGSNSFWATYSGDSKYGSTQTAQILVESEQAGTSLTLTASPNPAFAGQPITLTATLSQNLGNAQLEFFDGATLLNSQRMYSTQAIYTTTLAAGAHQLTVAVPLYNGFVTTPASLTEQVNVASGGQLNPGPTFLSGGSGPGALAAGDFNNDGIPDLAVANTTGQSISFYLGTNSAIFDGPVTLPLTFTPGGIAASQGMVNGGQSFVNLLVTAPAENSVSEISYSATAGASPAAGGLIPVGIQPVAVATADFNNDGGADIVTANAGSNDVSLLLTTGITTGESFGPALSMPAGNHPDAIVVADFNLDGQADFAVANYGDNNVMVFTGNGDGTFQPPVTTGVGSGPAAMVVADLNGDGKPDLAVVDGATGQVTILLGNGDGSFNDVATLTVGPGANSIAAANFGGAGSPGLAVTTSAALLVFSGNGDGTFNAPTSYSQYSGAAAAVAGSFGGDLAMEIALSLPATNSVAFLFNDSATTATLSASPSTIVAGTKVALTVKVAPGTANGVVNCYDGVALVGSAPVTNGKGVVTTGLLASGTHSLSARFIGGPGYASAVTAPISFVVTPVTSLGLTAPEPQSLNSPAVNLIPGDFNNDSKLDFVFEDSSQAFETLLGNGSGAFSDLQTGVYGGNPAVAADFNNDGYTDIAAIGVSVYDAGYPQMSLGIGGGYFTDFYQTVDATYDPATALAAADVNRDGWTDLIMANPNGSVDVLLGIGDGTFSPTHNFPVEANPGAVAIADLNEDGKPDIVVTSNPSSTAGTLTVALGNGDGTFSTQPTAIAAAPVSIVAADFNGDHHTDLAMAHSGNLITVLLGAGDGTFGPPATFPVSATPARMLTADMNGDGKADLVVMFTTGAPALGVLYGNGDGTFQAPVVYNAGAPVAIAVGDVNDDGRPDVVLALSTGSLDLFPGTGAALEVTQGSGQSAPINSYFENALIVSAPPGAPVFFTAPQSGASGVFTDTGTAATMVTADGSGTATSPPFFSNSVSGVYNITVDAPGTAVSTVVSLTNSAGAPASIVVISGSSQTQTISTAFGAPLQVLVKDASGNPVPNAPATFTAPASGASLTFASSGTNTVVVSTNASGMAISPQITANSTPGAFNVTATVKGVDTAVGFYLTNEATTQVTIAMSIPGMTFTVDGAQYANFQTYTFTNWNPGDTHTISVKPTQAVNPSEQLAFLNWSDGGAATHTITVVQGVYTITATVEIQYELITSAGAGGVISPATGFFAPGPIVITATPDPGYVFGSFDGIPGNGTGPTQTLNFTSAGSVYASFAPYAPVTLTRSGPLSAGEMGAVYTVTVDNQTFSATKGTITVVDNLPPGLTLVSISGGFFTCAGTICTTGLSLPPGDSWQIMLTVNVAANAPAQITNQVTVSGGGFNSVTASDTATLIPFQTIAFAPISSVAFGAAPFTVSATASSGLPVIFSSGTPSVCSVTSTTVMILTGGVCSIVASQAGNASYGAASVTQSFIVNPIAQTISFTPPVNPVDAPTVVVSLNATASSGLPVHIQSSTSNCSVYAGTSVYLGSTGPCTITFLQPGNASYAPATLTATFIIGKTQTITFNPVGDLATSTTSVSLTAASTSGLAVVFTSNTPSVCTVSQSTVTILNSGGCSITASQPGNTTYAPALGVTQDFTVLFTDVPAGANYTSAVDVFAQEGITAGCATDDFCPNDSVTRDQMAIFLVRAVYGSDNFTSSAIPYFTDVQPSTFGFKWIQKLYELGITRGCTATTYCPTSVVTRDQMAAFLIRVRYGLVLAANPPSFTYPATPYFTDVPATDTEFPYVQRMKLDGITNGCTATTYCPDDPVTRGDMAIFVMRAAFNQFLPAGTPLIAQISPAALNLGSSGTFTITGVNTNFAQGTTTLSPIPGVDIGAITVSSPTSLTVELSAAGNATAEPYSITVITGTQQAALPNGLVLQ